MATYNDFINGTYSNPPAWRIEPAEIRLVRAKVDFGYKNVAAADIIPAYQTPANTWIFQAWLRVTTAATTGAKADLGYSSDRTYWGAALPMDAAGTVTAIKKDAHGGLKDIASPLAGQPLFCSTATSIDLRITKTSGGVAAITAGVVEVCALIFVQKAA